MFLFFFFFQAEDGIRDIGVTGVQTCALPIYLRSRVNLKSLLPSADNDGFCRAMNKTTKPCFLAGDERVNENQGMQIH